MSLEKEDKNKNTNKIYPLLLVAGIFLVVISLVFLGIIFYPVLIKEISYSTNKPDSNVEVAATNNQAENINLSEPEKKIIVAADKDFSIVIPKIGANSKVVRDVDPNNSTEYQQKLTEGVAHAKGSVLPGQRGNSFYFAHSSDNFYNANRYNSVFYLLSKMESGDEFFLIFNKQIYKYSVNLKKIVGADEVDYIGTGGNIDTGTATAPRTATLMTCWPAGTTLRRLVVVGDLVD